MRILVTGREGQVAAALSAAGRLAGMEIVTAARPEFDLERPVTFAPTLAAARADVVISAAAYTAVDQAESEPERAFAINGTAPGLLAGLAAERGVPILHLSTDYVFDGEKPTPYLEDDPCNPQSVYGASKLAGERAVIAAHPRAFVVRTTWVFSAGGRNFVRTMLRLARERSSLFVVEDQVGAPTYALDIAAGLLGMVGPIVSGAAPAGVFHMTASGHASWADFAEAIFSGSDARGGPRADVARIPASAYPTPASRPANSRLCVEKLAETFGVRLAPWASGLDRCLDAMKVNGDLEAG